MRRYRLAAVFALSACATGLLLGRLSGSRWGRTEEHLVQTPRPGLPAGDPRLPLTTLRGPVRRTLHVPERLVGNVRPDDRLEIRVRTLPVAGVDYLQVRTERSGATVLAWEEGWIPFAGFLLLVSVLTGGLAAGATHMIGISFRLKTPED